MASLNRVRSSSDFAIERGGISPDPLHCNVVASMCQKKENEDYCFTELLSCGGGIDLSVNFDKLAIRTRKLANELRIA